MSKKSLHPLVGKEVTIFWKSKECTWRNYRVGIVREPLIQLFGLKQDNIEFTGRPIWVHLDDIEMIEEGLDDGS